MRADFQCPLSEVETSFRVFLKTQAEQNIPLHYHPNYEMNFVIRGTGKRIVGDNIEDFEEGDLVLLGPNIPHRWKSIHHSAGDYSSLVIQWKEDFLGNAWQHTPEFRPIRHMFDLSNKGIKFDHYIANEVKKNQLDLLELPPFKKLVFLLQLFNDLAKTTDFEVMSENQVSYTTDNYNTRLNIVFEFIKESYMDKITLAKVAALLNMSEGAFSRFFSHTMKKPFFSFLNEYRISMACKMLIRSDMQIKEIAYACGYDCPQFFYREFAKYKNCSPQTYRKSSEPVN